MKILIIDNNDSFTYNIADMLRNIPGADFTVILSNALNVEELDRFDSIIISPGPMKPADFPVLNEVISRCIETDKPLLGICLGHQAICEFFGGKLQRLDDVVHGHQKQIKIDTNSYLYRNLPARILAGLYHSWTVDEQTLPAELEITAMSEEGRLMSVQHIQSPIYGVQFHPESFLTENGKQIIENFLRSRR